MGIIKGVGKVIGTTVLGATGIASTVLNYSGVHILFVKEELQKTTKRR